MTTLAELENRIYEPSLKLWLPLSHTDGTVVDKSAYGTPFTLASVPYWTPLGWVMDGTNDEILATAALTTHLDFTSEDFSGIIRDGTNDEILATAALTTHLDFTSEDFSGIIRVKHQDSASANTLMIRSFWNQSGWEFVIDTSEAVLLYTCNPGVNPVTYTANSTVVDGEIYTIGFSRTGAAVKIYVNGIDKTDTAGTHTNPGTSDRILGIGSDGYSNNELKGTMKLVAMWSRGLAPQEHAEMHQMMREVFP
ncbi:hypothetical protein LCGC14_0796250 [marine sediment metagenome]|uniref:LamG-like jellyroll fold domain-containing protein n=1 Tax=marine sediment metagenome TaxID=412755 RepID=A0A0F9SAZ5_9ZZZZ